MTLLSHLRAIEIIHHDSTGDLKEELCTMNYVQTTMFMLGKPEPLRQSSLLVVLAGSIGHGETLFRALRSYELEQAGVWSTKVAQLRALLELGYSLSEALAVIRDLLPVESVSAIRIAEKAGTLPSILVAEAQRLSRDRSVSMLSSPLAVLGYLGALFSVMMVLLAFIMVFIIPKLKMIFDGFGTELPFVTRTLIAASDFFVNTWPAILPPLCAMMAGGIGVVIFWRYQSMRFGYNFLSNWWPRAWTPCILRQLSFASCARQPLVNSIDSLLIDAPPSRTATRMSAMRHRVYGGEGIVAAMSASGFLTHREAVFLTCAAESKHLDWAFLHMANAIELRRERHLQKISAIIIPILMLSAGFVILYIVVGLFMPIVKLIMDLAVFCPLMAGGST